MTQRNNGGPAYPRSGVKDGYGKVVGDMRGMSLRQYAAIELRVLDSGIDWLDDMIRQAKRDDLAGQALSAMGDIMCSDGSPDSLMEKPKNLSSWAYAYADAMIAARNKA